MRLYNSLTREKEEFIPREEGKVSIYTCGPTVYHFAHIGNLRSYIMEDVLEKYLRYVGYDVTRVMNITDVGHLTSDADTGVDKAFPIQAGREVRIMVKPEVVTEDNMILLARDIAKKIEAELEYPGQIKVNVIRETKAVEFAK